MTTVRMITLSLALAVAASDATAQTAQDTSALRREITALNRAMEKTVNDGNSAGAARFYADNAVVRGPTRVDARGRAQVDRYFAGIGKATWKLDVIAVGGHRDAPWQIGRSTLVHGARPDTSVVDFVVYWRRQADGQLKIELDYYTVADK